MLDDSFLTVCAVKDCVGVARSIKLVEGFIPFIGSSNCIDYAPIGARGVVYYF